MRRTFLNKFWLLATILLGCTHVNETARNVSYSVFFTANRQGEVDPCGCQVNQIGGMDRMQNFLAQKRTPETTLFLDGGDTFFSAAQINPSRKAQETLRAHAVAKGYRLMKVDAMVPGERDLAEGVATFQTLAREAGVKVLAANRPEFERSAIWDRGGVRFGVFGLVEGDSVKSLARDVARELRNQGAQVVILLSHLGLEQDRMVAEDSGIDLIIGSHSLDPLQEPVVVGSTRIVQPLFQGQQIGMVTQDTHIVVNLGVDYAQPNEITKLVENYKNQVRDVAVDKKSMDGSSAGPPYRAHPFECRSCHEAQYDFWEKTKHASAYLTLYAKNQHFDPECVGCHTLGYDQPAGFSALAAPVVLVGEKKRAKGEKPFVEKFMEQVFQADPGKGPLDSRKEPARHKRLQESYTKQVRNLESENKIEKWYLGIQCEHCHGNREGHPGSNTLKKVSLETCKQCHTPPNAKPFDPKTLARVACPRMK